MGSTSLITARNVEVSDTTGDAIIIAAYNKIKILYNHPDLLNLIYKNTHKPIVKVITTGYP